MKLRYITSIFILSTNLLLAQPHGVKIKPAGSWVTPIAIDKKGAPYEGEEASYYYLLIDEQENLTQEEEYIHYAYKILTSDGVQEASDLNIEFDPSYCDLVIHQISIHRGNETFNRLEQNIRTIQREQSMDRFMYDGTLTAVINLKDVRVGDIIEYSFSRKGYNPIYRGHFSRKVYFNYQTGYEYQYHKIISSQNKPLHLKENNTEIRPTIELKGNQTSYTWKIGKTHGFLAENNSPDWYDPWQSVSISDIKTWQEVAAWAASIFKLIESERVFVAKEVIPSIKADSVDDFILAAIRFVQDEIRYLGFEGGLNSHKPHPPREVFTQRFGDCKDKSLLLATLLEAKGIRARPVLVHTSQGENLAKSLPSLHLFNHCIVELIHNNKKFYIDPTINNQGGRLSNYYFPNYRRGLVIDENSTDIIEFPELVDSSITEVQNFDVATIGGEAMLASRTTYTGVEADFQRSEFANKNINEVQKNYLTFYSNLFPDISKFETIEGKDNRSDNVFNVTEKYKIPTFWKPHQSEEGVIYAEVYPQSLHGYFNVSKAAERKAPYKLTYPLDYYHTIHIKLPRDWPVKPVDQAIITDYYLYEYSVSYADEEITLHTHYQTKQPFVPAEAYQKFVTDHDKMMNQLTYSLTYNKNIAESSANPWPGALVVVGAVVLSIWLVILFYRYNPKPYFTDSAEPIGGWLIFVGLGVVLSPVRLLYDLFSNVDTILPNWYGLWISKNYGFALVLVWESLFNITNIFFSVLIAILFFQRRSSLPLLITIFYAEHTAGLILDVVMASIIDSTIVVDNSTYRSIVQSIFSAIIWIPYFRMSTRVKETFVNTLNDSEVLLINTDTLVGGNDEKIN